MTQSSTATQASGLSSERLIRFESPDEIRNRLLWRDNIDPVTNKPIKILGGYTFARKDWLACGMSTCRTNHGSGYVVTTNTGLETHIGKDCGKNLFNENFADMVRNFERAMDVQTRQDILRNLLRIKNEAITETKAALTACIKYQGYVSFFTSEIDKERSLQQTFGEAFSRNGRLFYSRKKTEQELELTGAREKFVQETAGRIDGIEATTFRGLEKDLQYGVLRPLYDLSEESLASANEKRLIEKTKLVGELRDKLRQTREFESATKRFIKPSNWDSFEALFSHERMKTTERGHRILTRLAARSRELAAAT
jgi:hypothetical protein